MKKMHKEILTSIEYFEDSEYDLNKNIIEITIDGGLLNKSEYYITAVETDYGDYYYLIIDTDYEDRDIEYYLDIDYIDIDGKLNTFILYKAN